MASRPANGKVPLSALVRVGSGALDYLEPATAAALARAQAENPKIGIAQPAGSYRSWDTQEDMHRRPGAYNMNPNSSVPLAAVGQSTHGWGTAVDIVGDQPWFLKNMGRFGFTRPFGASDPNHFVFGAPTWEKAAVGTAPAGAVPRKALREANRRNKPSTAPGTLKESPVPAGETGYFIGWIHGERVNQNGVESDIWLQGYSGDWFWSGSFVDGQNLAGLADRNAPVVAANQRQVLATAPARRRADAGRSFAAGPTDLAAGQVVTVQGWKNGEAVDGNGVWYSIDNQWSWSGAFTDTGTHDLGDFNPVTTPPVTTPPVEGPKGVRTVTDKPSNHRVNTNVSAQAISPQLAAGAVVPVLGYAIGQEVQNIKVWYKIGEKDWAWAGSFTSQDTTGLQDLTSETVVIPPIVPAAFGIDVSRYQAGLDMQKAKADGVQFVIIKAGGFNVAPAYVDGKHDEHVANARAAGLPIGHYWFTGKASGMSVVDQATYFVASLKDFDPERDVLVLDNELLADSNSEWWDDTKVSQFFKTVVALAGVDAWQMWHYFNDTVYQQTAWTETEKMGIKKWPSNYGINPTNRQPLKEPETKDWWVHQFSSQQKIAGYSGNVDGNWSKHSITELFPNGAGVSAGGTTTPPIEVPPVIVPPPANFKAMVDTTGLIAATEELVAAYQKFALSVQKALENIKIEPVDKDGK